MTNKVSPNEIFTIEAVQQLYANDPVKIPILAWLANKKALIVIPNEKQRRVDEIDATINNLYKERDMLVLELTTPPLPVIPKSTLRMWGQE